MNETGPIPSYDVGAHDKKETKRPWWDLREKKTEILIAVVAALIVVFLLDLKGPLIHLIQSYQRQPTAVVITSPHDQELESTNRFGAAGYVVNAPSANNASFWLVVYSSAGYYPYGELRLVNNQWLVPESKICTADGTQEIDVYEVPNSANGKLFDYINNGVDNSLTGPLPGGMPATARLMAEAHVKVAPPITPGC